jgi:hypothetical protein
MENLGDPEHDAGKSEMAIRTDMARAFRQSVDYIMKHKHGVDAPEFAADLEEWLLYTDKITFGNMFKKKVESIKSLTSLLSKSFDKMDDDLFNDLEFVNYITSVDPVVFKEELAEFLTTKIFTDAKDAFKPEGKLKELKNGKTKITNTDVPKIEFITREILHAIKLHDISNRMIEQVKLALREMLIKVANEDSNNIKQVMAFNRSITEFIKKTFTA